MSKGNDDSGNKGNDDPLDHDRGDDNGTDDPSDHDLNDDHGVDDPATHDVGDDHGVDDPATHDVGDDHGVDDPATHDVGDDHGVDDPATHDVGDDHGTDAALRLVFNPRSGQWIFTDDAAEHTQWLDDHGHDGGSLDLRGPQADEHTVAVWRFHDSVSDVYFWTADATLKNQLVLTQPQLEYDGEVFRAYADDHGGTRQAIGVVWDLGAGGPYGSFTYLPADDAAQLAGVSSSDDLLYMGVAFYL